MLSGPITPDLLSFHDISQRKEHSMNIELSSGLWAAAHPDDLEVLTGQALTQASKAAHTIVFTEGEAGVNLLGGSLCQRWMASTRIN